MKKKQEQIMQPVGSPWLGVLGAVGVASLMAILMVLLARDVNAQGSGYFARICAAVGQCHTVPTVSDSTLVVTGSNPNTAAVVVNRQDIITTDTDAFAAINSEASDASDTVQISPHIRFQGSAWDTDDTTSRTTEWTIGDRGVSGASPSSQIAFRSQVAGGGFSTVFSVSSAGTMINSGGVYSSTARIVGSASNGHLFWTATDGEATFRNSATTDVGSIFVRGTTPEAVTTTKAPTTLESNETYTNGADSDGNSITLPDDPRVGLIYHFAVTTGTSEFAIIPNTGESLYLGSDQCVVDLTATAVGATVTVEAITGGTGALWMVTATPVPGDWSCNDT